MTQRHSRNLAQQTMTEELHPTPDGNSDHKDEPAYLLKLRDWFSPSGKDHSGIASLRFLPIYFVSGMILFLLLWTVAGYLIPPGASKLWGALLTEAIFAVSAIAPAFAIGAIEDRRFGDYGLPVSQAFGKAFWSGVLWGLASLSLLLLIMRLLGVFSFGGVALHGARVWKFAAFWAVFFLLVALFEEFAFRGYSLFAVTQTAAFWPSALLSSVIFGYTHRGNAGETWIGALGAGAIGLFFCFTLRRTGNLWFAVGLHASWDWAQSFLYGVPDSGAIVPGHFLRAWFHGPSWLTGGTVGPEGSVLLFVVIAFMWYAFARLYPIEASPATMLASNQ